MPLRIKSLELQGYKTFAEKTYFEFAEGITAIVGPNGSGKSNIADSLRWVLGEQSYSLLRAKRTDDMIFAGSQQRARAGMASATLTFDNEDNWLPLDFAEVALTRRTFRDSGNDYMINSQRVRLKDVNELQADAGEHVEKLLTGEIKDVHDVMIAVEKAGTSFELMMELRNKMIDAYREVMRMQV